MAIDIKYFNSFVLKKTVNFQDIAFPNGQANSKAVFTGLPWNPSGYPAFIVSRADGVRIGKARHTDTIAENERNWIIEESRIRGGYNNTEVGYSPRAYLREDVNEGEVKGNALIY